MKVLKIAGALLLLVLGVVVAIPVFTIVGAAGPLLSWSLAIVCAVVLMWFLFGRRGSSNFVAGSESALMGRQKSKEGLL